MALQQLHLFCSALGLQRTAQACNSLQSQCADSQDYVFGCTSLHFTLLHPYRRNGQRHGFKMKNLCIIPANFPPKKTEPCHPLEFAAYTDKDEVFKDNVQLPAYLKKDLLARFLRPHPDRSGSGERKHPSHRCGEGEYENKDSYRYRTRA